MILPAAALLLLLTQTPEPPPASNHRLALTVAFAHWAGPTFGTPVGVSTPAVAIGFRPFLSFLELRGRYCLSVPQLDLPDGRKARVGWASLEVLATRELAVGDQALVVAAGPIVGLNHALGGLAGAYGLAISTEFLFATGFRGVNRLGVSVSSRQLMYQLPFEDRILTNPRQDFQIDIGIVATSF